MATGAAPAAPALVLICGDDDFSLTQRAREIFEAWRRETPGLDQEIIDATAQNAGEALTAIGKLHEALQTFPFFGGAKIIWFQNCTFLGDDRTGGAAAVQAALNDLADELKRFSWNQVRLLISAGKPDKRRTLFKTIEKLGLVETFTALSASDRDWAATAESHVLRRLRTAGRSMADDALAELVTRVGPNLRTLAGELDKLITYAHPRTAVTLEDVLAVVARQKQARAFALAEALGDRDLIRLLRTLDDELWEVRTDSKKSEIGLLYGLMAKVRLLLLLQELRREGLLKAVRDYGAFKVQWERLPPLQLSPEKRFNPLAGHPFTLFQAFRQLDNYRPSELVAALEILLECNRQLVSSDLNEALVLQNALLRIVGLPRPSAGSPDVGGVTRSTRSRSA